MAHQLPIVGCVSSESGTIILFTVTGFIIFLANPNKGCREKCLNKNRRPNKDSRGKCLNKERRQKCLKMARRIQCKYLLNNFNECYVISLTFGGLEISIRFLKLEKNVEGLVNLTKTQCFYLERFVMIGQKRNSREPRIEYV